MNTDQDVPFLEAKCRGDLCIKDLAYFLHLQIMVSGTERSHLIALALLGLFGDLVRLCPLHAAFLFSPFEVSQHTVAAFHSPPGPSHEHLIHFRRSQAELTPASHAGGDPMKERVSQTLLQRPDLRNGQTRAQGPNAAGDIKSDAS